MRTKRYKRSGYMLLVCVLFLLSIFQFFVYGTAERDYSAVADTAQSADDEDSSDDLNIHFYPLTLDGDGKPIQANESGDSFIISVGDTQILVDAGATATSAAAIIKQMKDTLGEKDKVWDYIIATHPDSDHIAAFAQDSSCNIFNDMFLKPSLLPV